MIKITLDTTNFTKTFNEYLKFQKRLPSDSVNASLYFIARNATQTTKSSSKTKIDNELRGPAKNGVEPLAAVLINSQLGKKGMKGLTGVKMARAVEKLIKARVKSVNYIRSGWKNAINILESYLRSTNEFSFVRRNSSLNSKADNETMKKIVSPNSGTAKVARIDMGTRAYGEIQNNVYGDGKDGLSEVKAAGLQKAIDQEEKSKRIYIERKINEQHQKFNR